METALRVKVLGLHLHTISRIVFQALYLSLLSRPNSWLIVNVVSVTLVVFISLAFTEMCKQYVLNSLLNTQVFNRKTVVSIF